MENVYGLADLFDFSEQFNSSISQLFQESQDLAVD
jgi:hypothetical protein